MADIKMLHTKAEVIRQDAIVEDGVIDAVVGSTNVLDRMGDVISQSGWDLTSYQSNPVILWGHNVKEERPPIGKALKVWLEGKQERSKKLMFKVKFDLEDTFAAEVFRKIKDGFVNTVSVGFLPTEWEELDKSDPWGGRKYTKQELLELSFVPVPANPEAVVALRSMKDKRFEPEELKDIFPQQEETKEEVKPDGVVVAVEEPKVEPVVVEEPKVEEPKVETPEESIDTPEEVPAVTLPAVATPIETVEDGEEGSKVLVEEKPEEDAPIKEPIEEKPVEDKPVEVPVVEETPVVGEPVIETPGKDASEEEPDVEKSVIRFKDLDILPESEGWDGPGEEAKAEVADLKLICAWYDESEPDNKSSYKLPHHKADGHKCVWRGVAAAMASLLGARGGLNVPDEDRKGIYNHLKKHYAQFDKPAPDFKMVEDQVLAKLGEEVQALTLDREDKHVVRLVKKVIQEQKEARYTSAQIKKALELLNLALSLYTKDSKKEVII